MKKFLWKALAVIAGLGIITIIFLTSANYSTGTRSGVVMKVSRKGMLFKTWEGSLNVEGINNYKDSQTGEKVMSSVWNFSVDRGNKEVIDALEKYSFSGKRVQLKYEEKYFQFDWRGDTKYFVTEVISHENDVEVRGDIKEKEENHPEDNIDTSSIDL